MSLVQLKQHLMQVKMATLGSLCQLFKTEPDMIRCMLMHLVHKGCVRQCTKKPACGSKCFKCPSSVTEIYEWIDGAAIIKT